VILGGMGGSERAVEIDRMAIKGAGGGSGGGDIGFIRSCPVHGDTRVSVHINRQCRLAHVRGHSTSMRRSLFLLSG
jgi:hypothetical protein